jgi:hypothetical protein
MTHRFSTALVAASVMAVSPEAAAQPDPISTPGANVQVSENVSGRTPGRTTVQPGGPGSTEAATYTVSKSNSYRTAKACAGAGGNWTKGREGVGCYLRVPANPAARGKKTTK